MARACWTSAFILQMKKIMYELSEIIDTLPLKTDVIIEQARAFKM